MEIELRFLPKMFSQQAWLAHLVQFDFTTANFLTESTRDDFMLF